MRSKAHLDKSMEYVLVSDECADCCYVSNALTLLGLSCKKYSHKEFAINIFDNAIATLICKNTNLLQQKKILETAKAAKKNIITWGNKENTQQLQDSNIHYLKMPFSEYELKKTLLESTNSQISEMDFANPIFEKLVGGSDKICQIKLLIKQVANSDTTVLILGESGTGKDIIASCIHQLSGKHSHHFVPINCGAIPSELMESELFGHEKGAFTGAFSRRAGRFEMANGGTLFLDEIGDMPLPMQVKLLRVLQDKKIERVGGNTTIDVDARLIAATHQKLEDMIHKHKFREDLFYRLNVFPIYVPSLEERKEDIPLIIDYHLDKIHERVKHIVRFTDEALESLCNYPWPGNIRELQNFLERMVILYPDRIIEEKYLNLPNKISSSYQMLSAVAY